MSSLTDARSLAVVSDIAPARFSWAAVFIGLATAVALNIILAEAWLGVGLLLVDGETHPGTVIFTSAIAWVLSACAALFVGGWVAGRVGPGGDRTIGVLHGAGVWATGAVVGVLFAVSAAGALVGGSVHIAGKGLEAAGQAVGGGVAGAAKIAAPNIDAISKELTTAVERHASAVAADPAAIDNRLADQSRLAELLAGHFTTDSKRTQTDAERAELVTLIGSQTGVSQAAAAKALEQWDRVWAASLAQWNMAKEEARTAADQARKVTAQAACWSVIAMALSALAALGGGALGVACRSAAAEPQPRLSPALQM